GYGYNNTIILVNGRRMPESIFNGASSGPNLNAIPVNLIERIEVLPASASAIYGHNAAGGAINIVLRQDANFTQFASTYNNATGGCDAPKMSYSFYHGRSVM